MDLREEYERFQKAQQAAKTASRQAGRIGATDVDRHRAYAAKQEMLRLEGEYRKSAQLNAVIPAEIQQQLADRLLATMRQELKNLLPHPLRGLTENFTDGEAPLAAMLDAQGQAYWGPGGGGGGGGWDGTAVDFYGTNILTVDITDPEAILGKYIVYHTGLSPTKHPAATWPKNISEGPWAWDTEVRGSPWMSWEVGGDEVKDENGNSYSPKRYSLAKGKTCGTIRIPVPIPTEAYQVIQLGAGTGTSTDDNGILAQYPRTHEL